jgi:hypothetical protein
VPCFGEKKTEQIASFRKRRYDLKSSLSRKALNGFEHEIATKSLKVLTWEENFILKM